MQWFPAQKYLWDFWFARNHADNTLHVFYLQACHRQTAGNPDLRHDFSSVGHAVMNEHGWQELTVQTPAFSSADGEAWDNRSIWTGCVIQNPDNQLYYMFYTARSNQDAPVWTPSEWQRPQQIGLAVSSDLMKWERSELSLQQPLIPNPGKRMGLDGVAWRDPYVIRGEADCWYAFVCARLNPEADDNQHYGQDAGGVVAWLRSETLEAWNCDETHRLIASDEFYQLEVPQVFWRNEEQGKRFYLLFSAQEKDCSQLRRARKHECATGTYYMSSELLPHDYQGLPALREPARILAEGLYAGRLLEPETTAEPLFFGFQWTDETGRFVGGLSDGQPVRFGQNGTLRLV